MLVALAIPLGGYIYKVMDGQKVFLSRVLSPVERGIYKAMGIKQEEEMGAKKYAFAILSFSLMGFTFLFLLQMFQQYLPSNPEGLNPPSLDLAFNTAASFVSNTNWQAYSGETTLSYFIQAIGLTVQNFVSAATGISVLFVLIRGFVAKRKGTIGNFWVDLTKITLYVLIPLSLIFSVILISQGVVQTLSSYNEVVMLESGAVQTEAVSLAQTLRFR